MRYIRSEQSSTGENVEHIVLDLSGEDRKIVCIQCLESSWIIEFVKKKMLIFVIDCLIYRSNSHWHNCYQSIGWAC